jgi:hypothetical protein
VQGAVLALVVRHSNTNLCRTLKSKPTSHISSKAASNEVPFSLAGGSGGAQVEPELRLHRSAPLHHKPQHPTTPYPKYPKSTPNSQNEIPNQKTWFGFEILSPKTPNQEKKAGTFNPEP